MHFLYTTQNLAHYPLKKEVDAAIKGMPNAAKGIFFTQPGQADHLGVDYDAAGRITPANIRNFCQDPDADFFICGPIGFMQDVSKALKDIGVIPARIHTEVFGTGSAD